METLRLHIPGAQIVMSALAKMGLISTEDQQAPILFQQLETSETILASHPTSPAPLPHPNPTQSFWLSPEANPLAREGSSGPLFDDADVVIIGSGITGVGVAYHLAKALSQKDSAGCQLKVVIVEARDFCSGATGRNGGHLTPASIHNFALHAAAHSIEAALRTVLLEAHTANSLLEIIHSHSLENAVDLIAGGHNTLLMTQSEELEAKKDYEEAKAAGADISQVQWLDANYMKENFSTPYPALRIPGHNLWPLKHVTQLYKLTASLSPSISVHLHTHTPATSVTASHTASEGSVPSPRPWTIHTHRGPIHATYVVHATNAYASHLLPQPIAARKPITPVRGQVVAAREHGSRTGREGMEGWGANEGFEYWFPRSRKEGTDEDPLIILGGGREASGPYYEVGIADDSTINESVGRALRRFLPATFSATKKGEEVGWNVEQEWSGIMGFTVDGDPIVGPIIDAEGSRRPFYGQYIAAGYSGHGMTRAFGCAEVIAQMLVADMNGHSEKWEPPAWLPQHYLSTHSSK